MPIVNVTGLTTLGGVEKDEIRLGIQKVMKNHLADEVELELTDTKVTFVEDYSEQNDSPAIAQVVSKYLQDMPQERRDLICDDIINVLEVAGKPYNEAYPVAVLGMRYRDNARTG